MLSFWNFTSIFGVEIPSNALFYAESFVLRCNTLSIIVYDIK